MPSDVRVEKLTRQAIALFQEERTLALKGDIPGLSQLTPQKEELMAQMTALAADVEAAGRRAGDARRREIATLFDIVRRRAEENQFLLKAAEAGVKSARRNVETLFSMAGPIGAYNETGEFLESKFSSSKNSQIL